MKGLNSCLSYILEFEVPDVIPKCTCTFPGEAVKLELGEPACLFPAVLPGLALMHQMNTESDWSEMRPLLFMSWGRRGHSPDWCVTSGRARAGGGMGVGLELAAA